MDYEEMNQVIQEETNAVEQVELLDEGQSKKKKKNKKEKPVIIYDEETVKAQEGKGTAAMILGIVGLCIFLGPISLICGLIATFLGAEAYKRSNKTFGKAGKTMGIISNCIWGLAIVIAIAIPIVSGILVVLSPFIFSLIGSIISAFG